MNECGLLTKLVGYVVVGPKVGLFDGSVVGSTEIIYRLFFIVYTTARK